MGKEYIGEIQPGDIFFIKNTVSERESEISGIFPDYWSARKGLAECHDWYRDYGTGRIWAVQPGVGNVPRLIAEE